MSIKEETPCKPNIAQYNELNKKCRISVFVIRILVISVLEINQRNKKEETLKKNPKKKLSIKHFKSVKS